MPRFAANLSMMYTEHPFLDRFAAAARDGFTAVEYLFPYEYPAAQLQALLADNGLQQVLFNVSPGHWAAGERGLAALPGREEEFRTAMLVALDYAGVLGNRNIHVMAGLAQPGIAQAQQRAVYVQNLAWAAQQAAAQGISLMLEPINTRDMPSYFLSLQEEAQAVCAEIGAPNLQVQFDIYHCQIMQGDLAARLQRGMQPAGAAESGGGIGHIQVASVPGRNEPDDGEINYPYLFELIDRLGYSGWIGCEYRPRHPQAGTSAGLGWLKRWL